MNNTGKIVQLCLLAFLLTAGCSQQEDGLNDLGENQPTPMQQLPQESAQQVQQETASKLVAEPLLYTEIDDKAGTVTVTANTAVNRDSVKQELAATWRVTAPSGASKVDYQLEFVTAQEFVVRITGLEAVESVYFSLDGAMSAAGQAFANTNVSRNQVIVTGQQQFQRLKWLDGQGEIIRELPIPSTLMIQPVDADGQAGKEVVVAYSYGSQRLVQLETGEAADSGLAPWTGKAKPFGNDYGADILYADRWSEDIVYGVYGNREVFSVNKKTGRMSKHYVSDKPIYGIASSPDGGKFALLVPKDESIGPAANLIVFDRSGKEVWRMDNAAYSGHSDGFIFPYAMSWPEENAIEVPTEISADRRSYRGRAIISLDTGTVVKQRNAALPDAVFKRFSEEMGESDLDDLHRVLPGSKETNSEGKYAIQGSTSSNWLINTNTDELIWLGSGIPLQWNSKGELVMWSGTSEQGVYPVGFE
jgi:hypothetical protein